MPITRSTAYFPDWEIAGWPELNPSLKQLVLRLLELGTSSSVYMDHAFSLNSTYTNVGEVALAEYTASIIGGRNLKKRKAEVLVTEDSKDREIGGEARQGESNNSKHSDIQKPDYIHIRACRGQATDSHSLAERKMKCLQDLVLGCNKVTCKAGMLDEIINYVQSLQRQVEFLSMKLAALNPRLDFNVDSFFMKEFSAAAAPSEMPNLAYLQFSQAQQEATGWEIDMPINPTQLISQITPSSSMSIPEVYPTIFLTRSGFFQFTHPL